MNIINIEQAEKLSAEIKQDIEKGTINFNKIEKFLIEFIELMNMEKFSQANMNLFSSLVGWYIQSKPNPKNLNIVLRYVNIYINIINNPSIYESRGIITI